MTGTVSPTIPTLDALNATEDPKTRSALITLRDALNAVLTSGNQLDGAQLATVSVPNSALATVALAKLANAASGKIIVGNGSNTWAAVTPTGDVTVSNTGVTTIGTNKVTADKLQLTAQNDTLTTTTTLTSAYQTLCSVTVASGNSYLVLGSVSLKQATPSLGSTIGATTISLTYNGSEHATDEIGFGGAYAFPINFAVAITSGTTILLKAKDSGTGTISARGADSSSGFIPTRLTVFRYA